MLYTMKELLDRASAENYAIAAPNVGNSVDVDAAIAAAEALNAPLILDVRFENMEPANKRKACPKDLGQWLRIRCEHAKVPIAINEDHGPCFKAAVHNIQAGVTSVMADRSSLPFEENVAETRKVCELAHEADISCEGELGHVGMANTLTGDGSSLNGDSFYTNVDEAVEFVKRTGVDCLAISIGTAHGKYPEGYVPKLDLDRLAAIKKALDEAMGYSYPLVLHGSSGTPNEQIKKACSMGINKVNINTDLTIAAMEKVLASGGKGNIWELATAGFKEKLMEMIPVYGSENKAW